MGGNYYAHGDRATRTVKFMSQGVKENFTQSHLDKMMDPAEAKMRESRDSDVHPVAVPIAFGMDVTGSMDYIPMEMIGEGLPKMISKIQEAGIPSPAIMFCAIGDSYGRPMQRQWDLAPLQVGQFESGDKELDMWLQKFWIEGGGWGNGGESYAWLWWFCANRVQTDHWDKRQKKGYIITTGDDHCLDITPEEFKRVLGITHEFASREDLYKKASEKWHVKHLCLSSRTNCESWQKFMGEDCIPVADYKQIPDIVADIVRKGEGVNSVTSESPLTTKITL